MKGCHQVPGQMWSPWPKIRAYLFLAKDVGENVYVGTTDGHYPLSWQSKGSRATSQGAAISAVNGLEPQDQHSVQKLHSRLNG